MNCQGNCAVLPVDPVKENYVRKVKNCIFSIAFPTPFRSRVRLVAVSKFGIWADQLGDGRTHLIGIYMNRNGDGRAVLCSSVREFLCSEAMHSLGIPTSRASRTLLDFIIQEHFPSVKVTVPNRYVDFFSVVVSEMAQLIALWMSVGFAHGVCNTDNFSLLSITIDYGPFGFMEAYNPEPLGFLRGILFFIIQDLENCSKPNWGYLGKGRMMMI